MRRLAGFLTLLALVCPVMSPAVADDSVGLVRVTPEVTADQVGCRLQTRGLPGPKQLQSMRSGLVSAVELQLGLFDEGNRLLGGRTVSLRLTFDLWDEVFSVRTNGRERRFTALTELRDFLAEISDLTVAPASLLLPEARYRVQVGMVVHPVAPDERARVEDVIVGDSRPSREGLDQQEASVSLGRLIRFFYAGGGESGAGHKLSSGWFSGEWDQP